MTVAERAARDAAGGVVAEIAARRLADVTRRARRARRGTASARAVAAAPGPAARRRRRSRRPGLHLIAEVKRRSPSAGDIAAADDAVARARAYAAGGAAVISVLCEPHWFGGSVDDLRAVRAAVAVPVLAKEFVVDPRQLDLLRAAGADLVLLLAVLHPAEAARPARRRRPGTSGWSRWWRRTTRASSRRRSRPAHALIGINNRDLRTLDVDPERAVAAARARSPATGSPSRSPASATPSTVARWRATGFDAALVGEALMRAADPAAAAARVRRRRPRPGDVAAESPAPPFVKICGVTDEAGVLAAVRAGADAIGLNFAPGTPRELTIDEGVALARLARAAAPAGARPRDRRSSPPTCRRTRLAEVVAAVDPDAVQLSGDEPASAVAAAGAAGLEGAPRVRPGTDVRTRVDRRRPRATSTPAPTRILLDTAGGPHPGGTGMRVDTALAAASPARCRSRWPAACTRRNVARGAARRSRRSASTSPRGTEGPRVAGERPRKDPLRVALFVKRARDARRAPAQRRRPARRRSTPGLLEADAVGRWGMERDFGGRYVPETLMAALEQLETAYDALRHDPRFWAELDELLAPVRRPADRALPGRPAGRGGRGARRPARRRRPVRAAPHPALRLYLKREDLAHTGAHKINNALGQALLTRRLGKTRVIAETGAGQHGVATATACALLGLPCVVFMGEEDIRRQAPERAPDARARRRGPHA